MKLDRSNLMSVVATSDADVQIAEIADALAALRARPLSNRHRVAVAALASAQAERDAARARQRELLARRRDLRAGKSGAELDAQITATEREIETASARVRDARVERDAAVEGCAAGVIDRLLPTVAAAEQLAAELLDTLEKLADPLAAANYFLDDNRVAPPRLLRQAPALLAVVREARRQMRGA